MHVDHFHVSRARSGIHSLKNEFLRSWDLQQSQILRRGADEDQIVVPDIIQGKQCPTLHPELAVEEAENPVQFVDRQDLAYPGVMIKDHLTRIGMFVCGRPTKLALLKITHGGCGPVTKRFQNTW